MPSIPISRGYYDLLYSEKIAIIPRPGHYHSQGIAFGGELEYADEMTLARSITNRLPVESYVANR